MSGLLTHFERAISGYKTDLSAFSVRNLFLLIPLLSLFAMGVSVHAADIDLLQSVMEQEWMKRSCSSAGSYLSSQNSNGSWSDINYSDKSRSGWEPEKHWERLIQMAIAYNKSGNSHYQSSSMKQGIINGLNYWNSVQPTSDNNFNRYIDAPMGLGEIIVLMEDEIPQATMDATVEYNSGGFMDKCYSRWLRKCEVGPDVARMGYAHVCVGLATDDPTAIDIFSERLQGECVIANQGQWGLQTDDAYHYHGPQIYAPWYSEGFYEALVDWGDRFKGLKWEFTANTKDYLRGAILQGYQWMIRRGSWDPMLTGRNLPSSGSLNVGTYLFSKMKSVDSGNSALYQAIIDHVGGKNNGSNNGHKHFWNSDYSSHRRTEYMVGLRMLSTRTFNQECGNGANTQNLYLSQGQTSIIVHGNEYKNIYGNDYKWYRIPGTTTPTKTSGLKTADWGVHGKTSFVGGVSDSSYGASVMDYNSDGVTGKKAWFFFDKEVVALGTGLSYSGSNNPVVTTLNQCKKNNSVYTGNAGSASQTASTASNADITGTQRVWHDQVGYYFPESQSVRLQNPSSGLFCLSIDHGNTPSAASYAYAVVPGMSQTAFDTYVAGTMGIQILQNDSKLQAVYDANSGVTGVVFWDPTVSLKVHDNLTIEADQNVVVLVNEKAAGGISVSVACPDRAVTATVTLTLEGGAKQSLSFALTGGNATGKSITKMVSTAPPAIRDVEILDDNTLRVIFDQSVTKASGENVANYTISPSLGSLAATLSADATSVQLATATNMTVGTQYTLTTQNIMGFLSSDPGSDTHAFTYTDIRKLSVSATSASSDDGHGPENTIDGNLSPESRWSSQGNGEWIQYDLTAQSLLTSVKIAFYLGDQRSSSFEVQVSMDGTTWTTVGSSLQSSGTTLAFEEYDVTDAQANYVRIRCFGNSSSDWNSVTEVELYGTTGGSSTSGSLLISQITSGVRIRVTGGALRINLPRDAGNAAVRVLDVSGAVRATKSNNQSSQISVRSLPAGIYFVNVKTAAFNLNRRIAIR